MCGSVKYFVLQSQEADWSLTPEFELAQEDVDGTVGEDSVEEGSKTHVPANEVAKSRAFGGECAFYGAGNVNGRQGMGWGVSLALEKRFDDSTVEFACARRHALGDLSTPGPGSVEDLGLDRTGFDEDDADLPPAKLPA